MAAIRWVSPLPLLGHHMPAAHRPMNEVLRLQSDALTRVREARLTARDAELDYVAAVEAARDLQCSAIQIAMAAGVTRQAIYNTLRKGT